MNIQYLLNAPVAAPFFMVGLGFMSLQLLSGYGLFVELLKRVAIIVQTIFVGIGWTLLWLGGSSNSILLAVVIFFSCFRIFWLLLQIAALALFLRSNKKNIIECFWSHPFLADQLWCWRG